MLTVSMFAADPPPPSMMSPIGPSILPDEFTFLSVPAGTGVVFISLLMITVFFGSCVVGSTSCAARATLLATTKPVPKTFSRRLVKVVLIKRVKVFMLRVFQRMWSWRGRAVNCVLGRPVLRNGSTIILSLQM